MTKSQMLRERANPGWAGGTTIGGEQCECAHADWDHEKNGGPCSQCNCQKFEESS